MERMKKLVALIRESENKLGIKVNLDNFQDRLVIQKLVYLLELSGIDLGYRFSLYVRGPYSPDLTRDIYDNKNNIYKLQTDYRMQENEINRLINIFNLSSNFNPSIMEIMATYLYFSKELGLSEKEAITNVKKIKSFYSDAKISIGISRAKELFISLTEKEISDIKEELKEWQEIAIDDQKVG